MANKYDDDLTAYTKNASEKGVAVLQMLPTSRCCAWLLKVRGRVANVDLGSRQWSAGSETPKPGQGLMVSFLCSHMEMLLQYIALKSKAESSIFQIPSGYVVAQTVFFHFWMESFWSLWGKRLIIDKWSSGFFTDAITYFYFYKHQWRNKSNPVLWGKKFL